MEQIDVPLASEEEEWDEMYHYRTKNDNLPSGHSPQSCHL